MIAVGDVLPDFTFTVMTPEGPAKKTVADVFGGRRVMLFAVPGAFTPTCHRNHLPGYIEKHQDLRDRGVDAVACVAVNDIFVLTAWAKASNADEKIEFLSDGNADFAKALGLELDGTPFNMGVRSRRYAMLVEDRVVKALAVEDSPSKADMSSAEKMMAYLAAA
jgi:peroxiredoxin